MKPLSALYVFRRISFAALMLLSLPVSAGESESRIKFYGFIRNDFYFNSRENEQSIDGMFHIHPKPVVMEDGKDINAVAQSQFLSIATRVGIDVKGVDLLGATSSAKVEADFAGFGNNFYVLRLRQAYAKLNWEKSELLMGQTWHPMFGDVLPTVPSLDTGSPFQPFNRSPQIRYKQDIGGSFSLKLAALYQMQYTSFGPEGASASYIKKAIMPNLFLGVESNTQHWTNGAGVDVKTLKPDVAKITSVSTVVYSQYTAPTLQVKAKAIWGENLTDQIMLSGYGASKINNNGKVTEYTNFNIVTSWLNVVYGNKWKVGAFAGLSYNLGTSKELANVAGKEFVYGRGIYEQQPGSPLLLLDQLYCASAFVKYDISKLSVALEYKFTQARFGDLRNDGKVDNPYSVNNHRIVATMAYNF